MTDATASAAGRLALRADLLDFSGPPAWGEVDSPAVRFRPDHWLLVDSGRIVGSQPGAQDPGDGWQRVDHRGRPSSGDARNCMSEYDEPSSPMVVPEAPNFTP